MQPFIAEKMDKIADLCIHHKVKNLDLFGSSTSDSFNPNRSDLDFLVEFHKLPPSQHADAFFGLSEDLANIFAMQIDLVEKQTINNPYLQKAIEQSRVNIYVES
ncbi:MAG: nucleotidyltransferase domain-containing protein [Magnetococcales bacterium]|nr:nucleotidyltransferase domain-containing protein [Magnetococcales bacterium]